MARSPATAFCGRGLCEDSGKVSPTTLLQWAISRDRLLRSMVLKVGNARSWVTLQCASIVATQAAGCRRTDETTCCHLRMDCHRSASSATGKTVRPPPAATTVIPRSCPLDAVDGQACVRRDLACGASSRQRRLALRWPDFGRTRLHSNARRRKPTRTIRAGQRAYARLLTRTKQSTDQMISDARCACVRRAVPPVVAAVVG